MREIMCFTLPLIYIYSLLSSPLLSRSANKCLVKVAHMCATMQNFQKAAELFEEVIMTIFNHAFTAAKIFKKKTLNTVHVLPSFHYFLFSPPDQIGKGCLDSGLLKYSAKDYFFKALLCWFCLDKEAVQVRRERGRGYSYTLYFGRERLMSIKLYTLPLMVQEN